MIDIKPIRTTADHDAALREIETLMDARPETPEGDRLDVLVTLVEAWEARNTPVEAPDPIALLEFAMEQRSLTRADLEPFLGSRGRISEILNRRRALSLDMIRNLHAGMDLPASALIAEYALTRTGRRPRFGKKRLQ